MRHSSNSPGLGRGRSRPMPDFAPHALDPRAAHAEVAELRVFLNSHAHLKEAALRDFFRSRPHASALIGRYTPLVRTVDLLAYEYPLFGIIAATWRSPTRPRALAPSSSSRTRGLAVCLSSLGISPPGSGVRASITDSPRLSTGSTSSRT